MECFHVFLLVFRVWRGHRGITLAEGILIGKKRDWVAGLTGRMATYLKSLSVYKLLSCFV